MSLLFQVNPAAADRCTQQIQTKLGDYNAVKHLLQEPLRLFGIDGNGPPTPGGAAAGQAHAHAQAHAQGAAGGAAGAAAAGGPAAAAQAAPEFKRPAPGSSSNHHHGSGRHHLPPPQHRGGFLKPADGKPAYAGRGQYPGQPVKHGGGGDHRSNGLVPNKGPPPASSRPGAHRPALQLDTNVSTVLEFGVSGTPPAAFRARQICPDYPVEKLAVPRWRTGTHCS